MNYYYYYLILVILLLIIINNINCVSYVDEEYDQLNSISYTLNKVVQSPWMPLNINDNIYKSIQYSNYNNNPSVYLLSEQALYYIITAKNMTQVELIKFDIKINNNSLFYKCGVSYGSYDALYIYTTPNLYKCNNINNELQCKVFDLNLDVDFDNLYCTSVGDVCILQNEKMIYIWQLNSKADMITPKNPITTSTLYGYNKTGALIIFATTEKIWKYSYEDDGNLKANNFIWRQSITEQNVTHITMTGDETIYYASPDSIYRQDTNYSLTRLDSTNGLPYNETTCMTSYGDGVYIGSTTGAMRYEKRQKLSSFKRSFRYFYGPRWLATLPITKCTSPNANDIVDMSSNYDGDCWILLKNGGLTYIYSKQMTLADKAIHYQSLVYPRHDRYGLVADCGLTQFGNLSTYVKHSTDNDGLWSSIYLASQAFRYSVTGDQDAKMNAKKVFNGLKLLNDVTGIKGFMARSVLPASDKPPPGHWYNSTTIPSLMFKGDTSSDEVTGHMWALPLYYDLVAETKSEKEEALELILNIVTYIIKNNFTLVGKTGRHTTWGVWSPDYLNNNKTWYDERGLNSLQILSFIKSAARLTNDSFYKDAFNLLVNEYNYDRNLINCKITVPDDNNFSDDELAFLPYFLWIHTNKYSKTIFDTAEYSFNISLVRSWNIIKSERPVLWNFIYGAYFDLQSNYLLDGISSLMRWPMSFIDWPYDNTHRLDITHSPYADRGNHMATLDILPPDERTSGRWNSDPYTLTGGSGYDEIDPSAWLVSYWLGRYLKLIIS